MRMWSSTQGTTYLQSLFSASIKLVRKQPICLYGVWSIWIDEGLYQEPELTCNAVVEVSLYLSTFPIPVQRTSHTVRYSHSCLLLHHKQEHILIYICWNTTIKGKYQYVPLPYTYTYVWPLVWACDSLVWPWTLGVNKTFLRRILTFF